MSKVDPLQPLQRHVGCYPFAAASRRGPQRDSQYTWPLLWRLLRSFLALLPSLFVARQRNISGGQVSELRRS